MYYVYVYLNPLKPGNYVYNNVIFDYEPFYVGKGKNYRLKRHLHDVLNNTYQVNSNKVHLIKEILDSDKIPIIMKVYENLSDIEASLKEKDLINCIGRIVVNNGPLTNITGGGEYDTLKNHPDRINIIKRNSDSKKGKKLKESARQNILKSHRTIEYRKMMSDTMKLYFQNNNIGEDIKNKISEKLLSKEIRRSDDTKKKIGDGNRYRKHTKKSRKNMSLSHIGLEMPKRVRYILISPKNEKYEFIGEDSLSKFINDNNMSIRIIDNYVNKGKIQIKRKTKKSINTEGWIVIKSKNNNSDL